MSSTSNIIDIINRVYKYKYNGGIRKDAKVRKWGVGKKQLSCLRRCN